MKILITKEFDFDLGSNMTAHGVPGEDPVTVKREIGEFAVAKGYAKEVEAGKPNNSKTLPLRKPKPATNAKTGTVGGANTGPADSALSGDSGNDGNDSVDVDTADAGTAVNLEG